MPFKYHGITYKHLTADIALDTMNDITDSQIGQDQRTTLEQAALKKINDELALMPWNEDRNGS